MVTLVIFLAIFPIVASFKYFTNVSHFEESDICVAKIIEREFGPYRDLVIVAESLQNVYIPETPMMLVDTKNFKQSWHENFLIYWENIQFFEKLNPKRKYLVVAQRSSTIKNIFNAAQKRGLYKFLLIHEGKTYYRRNSHFCGDPPLILHNWGCQYPTDVFKPRKKFANCRLKIGHIISPPFVIDIAKNQNPGIMVSMMDVLGKITNLGIVYPNSEIFNDEVLTNGSIHEISRALETGEIDLAIGRLVMNDTKTAPFDYGPVLAHDILKLVVPKPKKLKSYKKLFVVFDIEIWKKIFIGITMMIFIYYIFALFENFPQAAFFDATFDVFRASLGSGLSRLPKWMSFRILLSSFLLVSLCMDSIYLGNLSQIFASSSYDVNIDDLSKISVVHLGFDVSWRVERLLVLKYVFRSHPKSDTQLLIKNCTQTFLLNRTALAKGRGTVIFQTLLDSHPSELALVNMFRVITDYLTLFVTYYINKDTPFNEALTFWGHEIVEKGLPVKWFNDIKRSNVRVSILPEEEEQVVVLKLAHFEESFRVLFGGYILAVIALPLEFIFLKLEKIGVVQKAKDGIIYVVMLLKPPELQGRKKQFVIDENGSNLEGFQVRQLSVN